MLIVNLFEPKGDAHDFQNIVSRHTIWQEIPSGFGQPQVSLETSPSHAVLDGPRRTGDGYYESEVLDPDGNRMEITV